jgi:hypothetical protein
LEPVGIGGWPPISTWIIISIRMRDYGNFYKDDGDDTMSLEVLQGNAKKMLEGSNDSNDPSQSSLYGSFTLDEPTNEMEFEY